MLAVRGWLLVAIAVATAAHGQAPKAAGEMGKYTSKTWRWSISYPVGWTVETPEPDLVRIRSKAQNALCSVVSGPVDRFNTVDEMTQFMLDHDERYLREKGHRFTVLARRKITLPNGVVGNDVLAEIGPGGRSRRIHVLADGRGFALDCEAHTGNWARLETAYRRVMESFTVGK
jgi:hypothetical protein